MEKDKPAATYDEPTQTGWLRTELYGDKEKASDYVRQARTILGGMRSYYGVNERIAQGEGGGYYHEWTQLEDGTQVHALTNDGHDTLRIYASSEVPPQPSQTFTQPEETYPEPEIPTFEPESYSETLPTFEEEEVKRHDPEFLPYLWVGVRVKYDACKAGWYACLPILIEPDTGETRGILQDGSALTGWYNELFVQFDGDNNVRRAAYPAGVGYDAGYADPYTDLIGAMTAMHTSVLDAQPRKRLQDHCLALSDYGSGANNDYGGGTYFFSANGLRLYSSYASPNGRGSAHSFPPYDPLMTDAQNRGEGRSFNGRIADDFVGKYGWDSVFVLDPGENDVPDIEKLLAGELDLVDDRPKIINSSEYLQTLGMASGEAQVLNGNYLLAIMAYDSLEVVSRRTGQAIPGFDFDPASPGYTFTSTGMRDTFKRGLYGDYTEYMGNNRNVTPLQCEVEVRLGKGDFAQTFNFNFTVAEYSDGRSWTTPFGVVAAPGQDVCAIDVGYNAFGPNYSHPMLAIDVLGGRVELTDEVPEPVLGGGQYGRYGDSRLPMDIYICGDVFPVVADADFPAKAAQALFTSLEAITAGVFGNSLLRETTVGELNGVLAGITTGFVYRYDPMAKAITQLPIISAPDSYNYNNDAAGNASYYKSWLYWYYPYKAQSVAACHHRFAIVISSTSGFAWDANPGIGPDVPVPNCSC